MSYAVTRVCVFDVDHTITAHSTAKRFVQVAHHAGLFSLWDMITLPLYYLRYRRGTMKTSQLEKGVPQLNGKAKSQIEEISRECYAKKIRHDIYPGARSLVAEHKQAGDHLCLASASFETLLRPLADDLGIDHVIGTRLEFLDGYATGGTVGGPCFGPEKHRRVSEYVAGLGTSLDQCAFYSDSSYDLPLLETVARPVAVNPDPILRKEANKRGWPIKEFDL